MKQFLAVFFLLFFPPFIRAQLENIIVEKYYVADANDAANPTGNLPPGSVTYRIYVDMAPGYKLKQLYADEFHTFKIESTDTFYNHINGKSFGIDVNKNTLNKNTTALDSWLTLGQAAKVTVAPQKYYHGILKGQDIDGSFIGGTNNQQGLLVNADPSASPALTVKDGNGRDSVIYNMPVSYFSNGILTGTDDSTIFGSLKTGTEFIRDTFELTCVTGVKGIIPDSNQVLIAQLTTKGQLKFELNLVLIDANNNPCYFVADSSKTVLSPYNETTKGFLKYPPACGCTDPNYLEYSSIYPCTDNTACKTLVVLGCTDTMACNYNPLANYNVQALCCYPGYCSDRDLSVVCPGLSKNKQSAPGFNLFPNPAQNQITIQVQDVDNKEIKYEIRNAYGTISLAGNPGLVSGTINQQVDISNLETGLHLVRVFIGNTAYNKILMKN